VADVKFARAVLELVIDDKQYRVALGQVERDTDKTRDSIRGMGQALDLAVFKQFGAIAVSAIRSVGEAFVALVQRGAEVEGINSAFDALTAAIGETRESMLETTRGATKGLISDFDLMAASNKAMLLGLPVTSKSMGTMAQAAVTLGRAMGQDAKKSFDDLITALGRGSPLILDNLGITVRVSEANEKYAQKLGKTAEQLTEGEKKMAFYNAAMEAARQKVEEIGGIHLTLRDHVQVAMVTMQNFTDQLGIAINQSPVMRAGMEVLGQSIQGAFGSGQRQTIQTLMDSVNRFAIGVVSVAQVVVEGARFISNAWSGLQWMFNAIVAGHVEGFARIAAGLASFVEGAARIPGVGEAFKAAAAPARALADDVQHLATGFRAQATEALNGAARTNAALDTVSQVLGKTKAAMEANLGAAAQMGQGTAAAIKKIGDAGAEGSTRSAEDTKKIADAYRKLEEDIILSTKTGIEKRLLELQFAEAREIEGAKRLTGATVAEKDAQVALIQEKYRLLTEAASLGSDAVRDRHQQLQQEIQLIQSTGTARQLLELEFRKQAELASLEILKVTSAEQYALMVADTQAKYALLTGIVKGHYTSAGLLTASAGIKTRAELQANLEKAKAVYQATLDTTKYTYGEQQKAYQAMKDAEAAIDGTVTKTKMQQLDLQLTSAVTIMRSLFAKNKAAAIAATIIETLAAAVAAFRSAGGWPAGILPAAASLAYGYAQVNAIRSQSASGFAEGTPGLDFANFGRVSFPALHNDEAIIPRGGGHLLAGEIADAGAWDDSATVAGLDRLSAQLDDLPRAIGRATRNALLQAN